MKHIPRHLRRMSAISIVSLFLFAIFLITIAYQVVHLILGNRP